MNLFSSKNQVHSQALEKQRLEENFLKKLSSKCKEKDNSSCVMLKLVNYMNKILKKPAVTINDKFELLQTR